MSGKRERVGILDDETAEEVLRLHYGKGLPPSRIALELCVPERDARAVIVGYWREQKEKRSGV